MPTINLIYEQRFQKRQREQRSRMLVLGTVGAAAMIFLVCGYFVFETARYTIQSNQLEARRQELKPLMAEVDANKAELAQLQPRLKTLETALKDTERWSRLMNHLAANTPDGIWLTNIRCQNPDPTKGTMVQFTGNSVNQDLVGAFILRMDASEDLENVELKFTQERIIEGGKAIEFEITGQVVGTAPPKRAEEKA
jgi:Tfp pilus assembly protein PilN